jgi:hypothetical protein
VRHEAYGRIAREAGTDWRRLSVGLMAHLDP